MPLSTVFQSYNGDSSHYSCLNWVSPVLGWSSKVSCQRTLPQKTQRIQCNLNLGPLHYNSNTLPLSHAGPYSCDLDLRPIDLKIKRDHLNPMVIIRSKFEKPASNLCLVIIQTSLTHYHTMPHFEVLKIYS